jgi:archaellin
MDLDLMTSFGGGTSSGTGGGSLELVGSVQISALSGNADDITFSVKNAGSNPIDMTPNMDAPGQNATVISLTTAGTGTLNNVLWMMSGNNNSLAAGQQCSITLDLDQIVNPSYAPLSPPLEPGDAFTIKVKPQGGSTLTIQGQVPHVD